MLMIILGSLLTTLKTKNIISIAEIGYLILKSNQVKLFKIPIMEKELNALR